MVQECKRIEKEKNKIDILQGNRYFLDILVLGYAGAWGCKKILEHLQKDLEQRYDSRYIMQAIKKHQKADIFNAILDIDRKEIYAKEWIEVGEGGILACLYTLAKSRNLGLSIALKKIPILQSSVEICEYYGLNIYRLLSRCYVILSENGYYTERILKEAGFPCAVIGVLHTDIKKVIIDKEEEEHMNRPTRDEIAKLRRRLR